MKAIELHQDNLGPLISNSEVQTLQQEVTAIHEEIINKRGPGSDFLGWYDLPERCSAEELKSIKETAATLREESDIFVTIGIGGSYLGAKAAIEFVNHTFSNQLSREQRGGGPEVYFAGQNISSDYHADLFDLMEKKRVSLNVISKSGTTTEPAIAFRLLKERVEKVYGREEARRRIVVTTDGAKGALKSLADSEGYRTFVIPGDVGGRFSVLTPVGLLPIAVAGIDIDELMEGARQWAELTSSPQLESNPAYLYAAIRSLLYSKGKVIEMLSSCHPSLHYLGEWWKQLAGESEGKEQRGIFPAAMDLTTDLHSMGQWLQDGNRIIFETFMTISRSRRELVIPKVEEDNDSLNYIAGKSLDYVNDKAYRGTAMAHKDGGVPNMTIELADRSPRTLGGLFTFFERAIAMTGYLTKVNPFDQPGVEMYKKNMFSLLGKP